MDYSPEELEDEVCHQIAVTLMDAACERVAERVIADGGDPTIIPDEQWTAMVIAELGR